MKFESDIVNFFVFFSGGFLEKTKPPKSQHLQQRWISRGSSLCLGTLGGEEGMRGTRVQ
jgi:hypothetical protein